VSGLPFDILVITDRTACAQVGKTVTEAVEQILHSPLSHRIAILVRDKTAPQAHVAEVIKTLQPMTQNVGAKLLVHTHAHLALELSLDGVHVAAHVALEGVRSQLLPNMLLGASRHAQDALDNADIGLADYVTISPIYRPTSKPNDTREPLGISGLQVCVQRSVRPLVALGGMRSGRVAEVIMAGLAADIECVADSGCAAIAISGAILMANHPERLITELCYEIDEARR
jgi:thiamine-phosphate pyrophosphorylase